MKNLSKVLSLVLALAMIVGVFTIGASAFTDDEDISYEEAVEVLSALNILEGYTDGSFQPEGNVTRAEAAAIICRAVLGRSLADALVTTKAPFEDVKATNWAAGYIAYCVQEGIISGYGDGKFGPTDEVTGYQLAKMLLVALGFDAEENGLVGANWQLNTAKLAMQNGIFAGNLGANYTQDATREETALYTFNALFYTEDSNKTTSYTVTSSTGTTLYSGTDAVTALLMLNSNSDSTLSTATASTGSLADTVHSVDPVTTVRGAFSRPTSRYTQTVNGRTTTLADVSVTPDAVYTTAVTGSKIYADLGLTETPTSVWAYVNGAVGTAIGETGATVEATNTKRIGGNGILTEAYVRDDGTVELIQVQYTLGYVNNVVNYAATALKGAYTQYAINTVSANAAGVYVDSASQIGAFNVFSSVVNKTNDVDTAVVNGAVAKGDYVLIVTDATADVGTTYIYPAATVSGTLTAASTTTYTIGGTAYTVAGVVVDGGTAAFATTLYSTTTPVTFVVDSYGNVVAPVASATVAPNYAYVAYQETTFSLTGTNTMIPTITAYVVDTNGTISTMNVSEVGNTDVTINSVADTVLPDGLYTYVLKTDGTYSFTAANNVINGSFNYATSAILTGSVYGNANTVFYTITCDATQKPVSVTTTTGMANMGNVTTASGAYVATNNVATHVFLTAASAATAKVVYYNGSFSFDGTTYTYNVIANGVADTVTSKTANYLAVGLSSIDTSGNVNQINAASSFSKYTATYTSTGNTYGLINNGGLLSVVETVVATGVATTTPNIATVADTVPVYTISASAGTCTVSTAADMAVSGASLIYIQANTAADAIGAIYVIVA